MKNPFLTALFFLLAIPFMMFPAAAQDGETEQHSLQIQYLDENGSQVFPTYSSQLTEGEEYSIPSPASDEIFPNPETVSGVMGDEDVSEIVTYASRLVTVEYVYPDGSQAAPTFQITFSTNSNAYTRPSPSVPGYTPSKTGVFIFSGTGHVKVIYYPNKEVRVFFRDRYDRSDPELPDLVYTPSNGQTFTYELPHVPGFIFNPTSISGTKGTEALFYTVTFSREIHYVVINYVYSDGTEAAPTVKRKVQYNSGYSFKSPPIDGFFPDTPYVTGTMGLEDIEVTVVYHRESWPLTINYQYKDGTLAAESFVTYIKPGESYNVESPSVEGFVPDTPVVTGTMPDSEVSITVTYSIPPQPPHTLTIHYQYEDGSEAAPPYTASVKYNDYFSVPSPVIPKFTPERSVVSGKMGNADATFTVVYKPTKYLLTIKYNRQSGKTRASGMKIAPDYTGWYIEGEKYEVPSPSVMGYQTEAMTVTGIMPAHDVIETVSYILAGEPVMGDMSNLLDAVSSSGEYMREYLSKTLLTLVTAGLVMFAGFIVIRVILYIIRRFTRI